jgi:nucleoid-associated protein YgaU
MGLRYGLLAALTLILASALVWDRLHPPDVNRLASREEPAREDLAVVVVGGKPEGLPPPPPADAAQAPAGAPVAAVAPVPAEEGTYTVESGDTLGLIAQKTLGTSRKAADLARFNGISVDTPLRVGRELRIPPQAGPSVPQAAAPRKTHTVGHGETLFSIAKKYYGDGGKYRALAESNGLDPDSPLKVGREILLP